MNRRLLLCAVCISLLALAGLRAEEEREPRPRAKGVELYSWQAQNGDWLFVLVNGTNRLKTEAEIKETRPPLRGMMELSAALAKLAVGEMVFWNHLIAGFSYPPAEMRKAISEAAAEARIELSAPPVEE